MSDLVSIIIPTYNRAHLIADTLESIIAQTHANWECIVVDDGSTDHTEQLIATYAKTDSRFIYTKRPSYLPKGANACRNYGFKISNGAFINWFDSDDIMHANKLQTQLSLLQNNPESSYTICQSNWFNKEKNEDLGLRSKAISSKNRLEDYCLYNLVWLTTAPLWRRDFIELHNLSFDETLHQSQEYDFHIRALSISDEYIPFNQPLLTLIKHKDAISTNIFQDYKIESNIKVKDKVTQNYAIHFTEKGRLKWLEILTLYYKQLLLHNKSKFAKKTLPLMFKAIKTVNITSGKKIIFKVKVILAFISFVLFGKGYTLVKPITK